MVFRNEIKVFQIFLFANDYQYGSYVVCSFTNGGDADANNCVMMGLSRDPLGKHAHEVDVSMLMRLERSRGTTWHKPLAHIMIKSRRITHLEANMNYFH